MLELKNIVKDYIMGNGKYRALKGIDLKFKAGEFVAILGPSGCGKTTTLNIIGGLDRYTSGDLIINGKSTKDFKDKDWDAYRNNSVGFVFQSYNLISHLTVLDNIELGMTLSGVSSKERRTRALEVLQRVGLKDHVHKKPALLSGGQKQRVAIARALVNDPDIILADEPTGALDSKTAVEILDLIKEIAENKLVIMVTHDKGIAESYASRIVNLLDGEVQSDTNPVTEEENNINYEAKKTSMSFLTALKLSFNNLRTKIKRTLITAVAASIGIVGVGLVLALSNGFSGIINDLETSEMVGIPLILNKYEMIVVQVDTGMQEEKDNNGSEEISVNDPKMERHINNFTPEFLDYLKEMDSSIYNSFLYAYGYQPHFIMKDNSGGRLVDINPSTLLGNDEETLSEYYNVLKGSFPTKNTDVVLLVHSGNSVDKPVLEGLGLDLSADITFDDIIGMKLYVANNNNLYSKSNGRFHMNYTGLNTAADEGEELTITGIIEINEDKSFLNNPSGIYFLSGLETDLIAENKNSDVCMAQRNSDLNVFDGTPLTENDKDDILSGLGCNDTKPSTILVFSDSFEDKGAVKSYINSWNQGKESDSQIKFTDIAESISDTLGSLIGMISTVLTFFASISLVVSSVMIGIIIYVSVLERTKEIGVIRSLGGRKKDITRVFNAESIIVGFIAGIIGVLVTMLLTIPINLIVEKLQPELAGIASVNHLYSIGLVLISTTLTFIGGYIPARIAAKKDPVEALRSE